MKVLIVFCAFLVVVAAKTSKWVDFRVTFSQYDTGVNVNSFFKIQNTLSQALSDGWVRVTTANELGVVTVCRTSRDHRLCPIYDRKGFIAGMQMAIPPSDYEGQNIPYYPDRSPMFETKTINGITYWTSIYYVIDPEVVRAGGRDEMTTIGTGLWFKNGTTYTEYPTDEHLLRSETPYKWQNCVPNMGRHYYYNMTPTMDCEKLFPFFLLVKDDNVIGTGWQFYGRTKYVDVNWYDNFGGEAVLYAAPLAPSCLGPTIDKYGAISIHMYFIDKPWNVPCNHTIDSIIPPKLG